MAGTVYVITDKTNGKKYVGQTINSFKSRKKSHLNQPYSGDIGLAIQRHGKENFEFEILEENIKSYEELNFLEKVWIYLLGSMHDMWGYNKQKGGNGNWKPSQSRINSAIRTVREVETSLGRELTWGEDESFLNSLDPRGLIFKRD